MRAARCPFRESCVDSWEAYDETLLLQDGSIGGAQFDFPFTCSFRTDGVAAERPIPAARSGCHAETHDLVHAVAAVPAMFDCRVHGCRQARVEEERSWLEIIVCRRALPVR